MTSKQVLKKITVTQDFDAQLNHRSCVNAKERFSKCWSSESRILGVFFL